MSFHQYIESRHTLKSNVRDAKVCATKRLSSLDDVMLQRMKHIVVVEQRPFSYKDFTSLMKHGTFRNNISQLRREGMVQLVSNSHIAFYTFPGHRFSNRGLMTDKSTRQSLRNIVHKDRTYDQVVKDRIKSNAAGCEAVGTNEIKVNAGRFGAVTLYVCPKCLGKFQD
jgi:hypothetical protein